jgi:subtilisin family serine protease
VPPAGETRFVPDEVILSIAANVPEATLRTIARQHRLNRMESKEFTLTGRKLFRWRIMDGRSVGAVIRALQADGRVIAAQPNYLYTLTEEPHSEIKSAPLTGDPSQYALGKLRLLQAHSLARGEGIRIAVIDTSLDAAHPDLSGAVAETFDATGTADRPRTHGTAMASAIAAHGKILGMAPAAKLLSVQAFGTARSEGTGFNVLKGLEWAAGEKADIVNMSFAGPADPALQVMLGALREKGIVLIAAAGNAGPRSRPLYPAADANVIAVTATGPDDKLYPHANRGAHIAVAAPGVNIFVAAPESGYDITSGTSVAAAEVSGIVALMLERERTLDPASVRRILMSTARDLGPPGPDDQFGAGLVDALGALTAIDAKPTAAAGGRGKMTR